MDPTRQFGVDFEPWAQQTNTGPRNFFYLRDVELDATQSLKRGLAV